MTRNDFLVEKQLHKLDPDLHRRFANSIFLLPKLLSDYLVLFPEFTDHSETHSVAIIDYCNKLIGHDNLEHLNADELYVLLMGAYLHDVGMGVSEKDFQEFSEQVEFDSRIRDHENASMFDVTRAYHNDFSACFIEKYSQLFDFPSEAHEFAVIQTARGHRKADLFDEAEYPAKLPLENGNTVCLPYLTAIVRLADEVNIEKDRNLLLTVDPSNVTTERQRLEFDKHEAVKKVTICEDRIELDVQTDDPYLFGLISQLADKVQETLDYCVRVVDERTDFVITQKKIQIVRPSA